MASSLRTLQGMCGVHSSVIEMPGFRTLTNGQQVEFRYEPGHQDSWNYRATWVRPLEAESDSE